MVNNLTNNLPGPDKGLIDVLKGGQQAPEAILPTGQPASGAQPATPEDFMKILAKTAQDQPQAALPAGQQAPQTQLTKGGSTQVMESTGTPAKTLPATERTFPQKKKNADEVSVQAASAAAAQAAVVPAVGAQATAKLAAQEAARSGGAAAVARATTGLQGKTVQKQDGPGSSLPDGMTIVSKSQLAELVARSQQAQNASQAAESSRIVLQPIVMQMPIAVPVAMEELDAHGVDGTENWEPMSQMTAAGGQKFGVELGSGRYSSQNPPTGMLHSQDFLARRGNVLGVDRPDPRLTGRPREDGERLEDSGARPGLNHPQMGWNPIGLPHVTGLESPVTGSSRHADGVLPMTVTSSGNTEMSSPMALASQLHGLAARGGGTIRMKVVPESLGEVTISVQNQGQKLNVKFEASSNEARDALANALPELRQALAASRYDVGSIEVDKSQMSGRVLSLSSSSGDLASNMWAGTSSQFSSGEQWRNNSNGGDSQGGSAWDRYFAQQDARQQQSQHGGGRQQSAYRRYQENEYGT